MTKPIVLVAIMAAAAATTGCSSLSRAVGAQKVSPDEFRVVTRAPLTLPPDYSLRPPRPGEPRPQELEPDAEARAALFGSDVAQQASQGERSLVTAAGAQSVDPDIRDTIDFESQGVVRRNEGFVDRLLSFRGADADAAAPLDAAAEERRLAEQESIRRATGGGRVTIERDRGGFKLPGT
ncbi:DUF3035 domain-containing protein [Terricaulis sp.]|uniref:DUF3035 domain-containing protein n=1 Tax=Terricaulis sp. TaxID=2768686 RepID=UPI00378409C5